MERFGDATEKWEMRTTIRARNCIACYWGEIPDDHPAHLHERCGQRYHAACYDREVLRQRDQFRSRAECLYCGEAMLPRGREPPHSCIVCMGEVADVASSGVYVHPACQKPYHTLCADIWLRREETRGRCAYCTRPVHRRSEWFARDAEHEWWVERFRDCGVARAGAVGWNAPHFNYYVRSRLAPVMADYKRLERAAIPYYQLPILDSIRREFPQLNLNEYSLVRPVLVEPRQLLARDIAVNYVRNEEYRQMALEEENRFNEYAHILARYFYFYPPRPSSDVDPEDMAKRPAETLRPIR